MERRRPNREFKNSEDVQDALIEDYFRYKVDSDLAVIGRTEIWANTENIRIGLVFVVLAQ
jgi:hypothetical protein